MSTGPGGSGCPVGRPFAPTFSAGTANPLAGAYSPLAIRLTRNDGTDRISGLEFTLPEGLTGKLAGDPLLPRGRAHCRRRAEPARPGGGPDRQSLMSRGQPGRDGHRRRGSRAESGLRQHWQGLPRGPLQRSSAEHGNRRPGGDRALRPRQRRGQGGPVRRSGDGEDPGGLGPVADDPARHPARPAGHPGFGRSLRLHPQPDQLRRIPVLGLRVL